MLKIVNDFIEVITGTGEKRERRDPLDGPRRKRAERIAAKIRKIEAAHRRKEITRKERDRQIESARHSEKQIK